MINTIDLNGKDILEEKERKKIINILTEKGGLDKSFASKKFENLNGKELDAIFSTFEKEYNQIKHYFKSNGVSFPTNFDDFKKIPLGKCKTNIKDYKFDLLDILAKNKKSDFLKYINPEIFLHIQSESSDSMRNYILSRIDNLQNLAIALNKLNDNQIKTLGFIIRKISNEKKILDFIRTTDGELSTCLDNDPEMVCFFIKNLNEENIKLFFDINKYGDNQLKIAENCYYKEKMVNLIIFLECQIFLYKAQEIDPKIFAELIDRCETKILGEKLINKELLNFFKDIKEIEKTKNTQDIENIQNTKKELINKINEESLSRKTKK